MPGRPDKKPTSSTAPCADPSPSSPCEASTTHGLLRCLPLTATSLTWPLPPQVRYSGRGGRRPGCGRIRGAGRNLARPHDEPAADDGRTHGDVVCWSATADLVAGAGVAAVGVACVSWRSASRPPPGWRPVSPPGR
ncbi:DUF6629 family protein [Streptomyces sp. NPDC057456]|uniref:DUF6629 family protein n=1 Tax=Streptomyces sp. NPDC057456 TaxID=3346139 RepID=UPI00369510F1